MQPPSNFSVWAWNIYKVWLRPRKTSVHTEGADKKQKALRDNSFKKLWLQSCIEKYYLSNNSFLYAPSMVLFMIWDKLFKINVHIVLNYCEYHSPFRQWVHALTLKNLNFVTLIHCSCTPAYAYIFPLF